MTFSLLLEEIYRIRRLRSLIFLLGSKRQILSSLNKLITVLHLPFQFIQISLS